MNCRNCNAVLNESDKFCTQCGTANIVVPTACPVEPAAPQTEPMYAPQPEPEFAPQPEPMYTPQPEPAFAPTPQPEPMYTPQPEPAFTPAPQPEPMYTPQPEPIFNQPPVSTPVAENMPVQRDRTDAPLSTWGYMWRSLVFAIPVVGIVFLFVFAFASGINKNSKHYASAMIIWGLIGIALLITATILFFAFGLDKPVVEFIKQATELIKQTTP